jgi:hypothetical protein
MSNAAQANNGAGASMSATGANGAGSSGAVFKRQESLAPSGGIKFIRPSKLVDSDINTTLAEGTFVGTLKNNYDDTKLDYKIEAADGSATVINGAGNLARQMSGVSVGTLIQVNYLGKQEIRKGKMKGKMSHNFEVLVADNE